MPLKFTAGVRVAVWGCDSAEGRGPDVSTYPCGAAAFIAPASDEGAAAWSWRVLVRTEGEQEPACGHGGIKLLPPKASVPPERVRVLAVPLLARLAPLAVKVWPVEIVAVTPLGQVAPCW